MRAVLSDHPSRDRPFLDGGQVAVIRSDGSSASADQSGGGHDAHDAGLRPVTPARSIAAGRPDWRHTVWAVEAHAACLPEEGKRQVAEAAGLIQKLARLHSQRLGDPGHDPDGGIATPATLQPRYIGAMQVGLLGERFLRHLHRAPNTPHVQAELFADVLIVHERIEPTPPRLATE